MFDLTCLEWRLAIQISDLLRVFLGVVICYVFFGELPPSKAPLTKTSMTSSSVHVPTGPSFPSAWLTTMPTLAPTFSIFGWRRTWIGKKPKYLFSGHRRLATRALRGGLQYKGKTLREKYSPEKFEMLVNKRRSQGLFYEDDDFPGDLDEA